MPYKITETQDGFNVVNTETGKTKNAKPYVKRDDALKYQRALSAAENQTTKADTYKVPEAARNNARKVLAWREKYGAEVNGMTEVGWRRARQLADNVEIGLETVKRMAQFARHRKNSEVAPEYKSTPWKDAGYVAWLGWGGTSGIEWARGVSEREKGRTLKELFLDLVNMFIPRTLSTPTHEGFTVFKSTDGDYRWVLISSNAYRDRDGEIVSQKALQADVERADADGDYGPLRWWHMPGVDIGETDFNMLHGKMLIESGTFDNPTIAAAVAEKADDLQASIAFRHPANEPNAAGVFDHIRRFERSLVPKGRASNWLTSLAVTKGENMSTLAEKINAFKALLKDDELANHILQQAETKEKDADAAGLAFKEATTATPDPSTLKEEMEVETETETETPDADEARMTAIVQKAMAPYMEKMSGMVEEVKAMYSKKDDTAAQAEAARQTTLKAYGEKLTAIETQQAALAKTQLETIATLKEAQKEVKTLMGDLPKGVGAFIASTAKETEVDEDDERLKAAPSQDPHVNTDFMSFILPNGQFAPQGQR